MCTSHIGFGIETELTKTHNNKWDIKQCMCLVSGGLFGEKHRQLRTSRPKWIVLVLDEVAIVVFIYLN